MKKVLCLLLVVLFMIGCIVTNAQKKMDTTPEDYNSPAQKWWIVSPEQVKACEGYFTENRMFPHKWSFDQLEGKGEWKDSSWGKSGYYWGEMMSEIVLRILRENVARCGFVTTEDDQYFFYVPLVNGFSQQYIQIGSLTRYEPITYPEMCRIGSKITDNKFTPLYDEGKSIFVK